MFRQLEDLEVRDNDDEIASCLLRAHFASFLDGIESGHIELTTAKRLHDELGARLHLLGYLDTNLTGMGRPLPAQTAWAAFRFAVRKTGDSRYSKRRLPHKLTDKRKPSRAYGGLPLVTLGELGWHEQLVRVGATVGSTNYDLRGITHEVIDSNVDDRTWLSRCVECMTAAIAAGLAPPGKYLKGSAAAIIWLAPLDSRIEALLGTCSADGLPQGATDRIRDMLGLWVGNGDPKPYVIIRIRPHKPLYAPNVITAAAYPRFRHRPTRFMAAAPHAGLTYNLNRAQASVCPGLREVVATGIRTIQAEEFVSCGAPGSLGSDDEILAAHMEYAKHVCRRRSWRGILRKLEKAVK